MKLYLIPIFVLIVFEDFAQVATQTATFETDKQAGVHDVFVQEDGYIVFFDNLNTLPRKFIFEVVTFNNKGHVVKQVQCRADGALKNFMWLSAVCRLGDKYYVSLRHETYARYVTVEVNSDGTIGGPIDLGVGEMENFWSMESSPDNSKLLFISPDHFVMCGPGLSKLWHVNMEEAGIKRSSYNVEVNNSGGIVFCCSDTQEKTHSINIGTISSSGEVHATATTMENVLERIAQNLYSITLACNTNTDLFVAAISDKDIIIDGKKAKTDITDWKVVSIDPETGSVQEILHYTTAQPIAQILPLDVSYIGAAMKDEAGNWHLIAENLKASFMEAWDVNPDGTVSSITSIRQKRSPWTLVGELQDTNGSKVYYFNGDRDDAEFFGSTAPNIDSSEPTKMASSRTEYLVFYSPSGTLKKMDLPKIDYDGAVDNTSNPAMAYGGGPNNTVRTWNENTGAVFIVFGNRGKGKYEAYLVE